MKEMEVLIMTQQRLVDIINSTGITQRVSWNNIKYDADKAIAKINSYLGVHYPEISKIMLSPQHTYSIRVGNKAIPIFPYRYFHTVVIPFIITEILSREEEFTTIYNKYLMELEDGLFDMFQNEFNRIPKEFKQSDDVGVFFDDSVYTKDTTPVLYPTAQNPLEQCLSKPIISTSTEPLFKFRVHYHVNNSKAVLTKRFTFDKEVYGWEEEAVVLPISEALLVSVSGDEVYRFKGWTEDPRITTVLVDAGTSVTFSEDEHIEDINLYAVWDTISTFQYTSVGFRINEEYGPLITTLTVPEFVGGHPVTTLASGFDKYAPNLTYIKLPSTLSEICTEAFSKDGLVVAFPEYDYLYNRPDIILRTRAFNNVMEYVYLPYSIRTMETKAFANTRMFGCEVLDTTIPEGWAKDDDGQPTWCPADSIIYWGATNG